MTNQQEFYDSLRDKLMGMYRNAKIEGAQVVVTFFQEYLGDHVNDLTIPAYKRKVMTAMQMPVFQGLKQTKKEDLHKQESCNKAIEEIIAYCTTHM
ncbi:MAG: hypothetical protein KKF89_05925 [Nanoarchaeota archaeon]|nr:hypothetical protein [Nanoarchaeota archaeon]